MLVRDLAASVAFYRDVLGLRPILHDAAPTPAWALLRHDDAALLLEAVPEGLPLPEDASVTLVLALPAGAHERAREHTAVRVLPDGFLVVDPDGARVVVRTPEAEAASVRPRAA